MSISFALLKDKENRWAVIWTQICVANSCSLYYTCTISVIQALCLALADIVSWKIENWSPLMQYPNLSKIQPPPVPTLRMPIGPSHIVIGMKLAWGKQLLQLTSKECLLARLLPFMEFLDQIWMITVTVEYYLGPGLVDQQFCPAWRSRTLFNFLCHRPKSDVHGQDLQSWSEMLSLRDNLANQTVTIGWWNKFYTRHPELVLRTPATLSLSRASASTKECIDNYFWRSWKSVEW